MRCIACLTTYLTQVSSLILLASIPFPQTEPKHCMRVTLPTILLTLETYANIEKSAIIQACPGIVYFKGYMIGQTSEQTVVSISEHVQDALSSFVPPGFGH